MSYQLPQRQLVSQADSATIENANVPRSKFLNTWTRKTAFDAGYLIPILVDEILPGDHMSYDITAYLRMSTPLFPMFDNQRVDTHFFFVPNRLVWDNWVRMMGEQDNPSSSIAYTTPVVPGATGGEPVGSLYDHMGIPVLGQVGGAAFLSPNALPFRAYNLIYNTWFRDENITTALVVNKADGPDTNSWYYLQRRAKSHDYFTSALPWPQKFTAPTVPLGGLAPVIGIGSADQVSTAGAVTAYQTDLTAPVYGYYKSIDDGAIGKRFYVNMSGATPAYPQIWTDLAQASGVAINTLRQAFLVQELLERDARGGTRYVELIRSHFGVINPDFRLQRPEYIGGGNSQLNITPIAQTAPAASGTLGALGGAGTSAGRHHASYAATEHGFIIGLISIKTELSYQQGLHKMYSRATRYDYYWPTLANLGEQAILQRELYETGGGSGGTVFGYQERWQEYRTKYSDVTGIMRSTAASTIDMWHLAQKFTTNPVLNTAFIEDTPPMTRVLAAAGASTGQQYLADIMYHRTAVRPIPTYGTPVSLGRF